MRKTVYLQLIFSLSMNIVHAQTNLIINPSFEININCPYGYTALTNGLVLGISNPANYTPDYFNICSDTLSGFSAPKNAKGYQNAKTGNAYVGIFPWGKNFPGREYIQMRLSDSLKVNHHYTFKCYLSSANLCRYAVSDFGAYFSNDSVSMSTAEILPFTPQISNPLNNYLTDTLNWMEFTGEYLAQGGERYIILGNFNDGTIPVDTAYQYYGGTNYQNHAYYYIDDVSLIDLDSALAIKELSVESLELKVVPNPAAETITLLNGNKNDVVTIKDITGKTVMVTDLNDNKTIYISRLNSGLYFIFLQSRNKLQRGRFIKE